MNENCIEFKNHVLKYMRTVEASMSMTILQEECGELIQAISKFFRTHGKVDTIKEELTHVLISIYCVMINHGITIDDIMEEIRRKDAQL